MRRSTSKPQTSGQLVNDAECRKTDDLNPLGACTIPSSNLEQKSTSRPRIWSDVQSFQDIPCLSEEERDIMLHEFDAFKDTILQPNIRWTDQPILAKAQFVDAAMFKWPFLNRYQDGWPVEAIARARSVSDNRTACFKSGTQRMPEGFEQSAKNASSDPPVKGDVSATLSTSTPSDGDSSQERGVPVASIVRTASRIAPNDQDTNYTIKTPPMRPGRIPTLDELLAAQAQRISKSTKRRVQGTKRKASSDRLQHPTSRRKTVFKLTFNKQELDGSDLQTDRPTVPGSSTSSPSLLQHVCEKHDASPLTAGDSVHLSAQPTPDTSEITSEMKKISDDLGEISTIVAALQEHCHGQPLLPVPSTYYSYDSNDTSGSQIHYTTTSPLTVDHSPINQLLDDEELCTSLNHLGIEVVAELQDFASWPNQQKREFLGETLRLSAFAVDKAIAKIALALNVK
ncbi:hypothetical protein EIP86_000783 [Pleurotus ostreatoroseus]|nr:hypothetical protein EIP86_000783 [Pleurotus ostreatoroseus]